jgi:hypothetical protein
MKLLWSATATKCFVKRTLPPYRADIKLDTSFCMNRSTCALGYIITYFSGEPDPHESRQVTASFPRHRCRIFPTLTSLLHKYTITQCRPLIYYHMPLCKCVCMYVYTLTSTQRWNSLYVHIMNPPQHAIPKNVTHILISKATYIFDWTSQFQHVQYLNPNTLHLFPLLSLYRTSVQMIQQRMPKTIFGRDIQEVVFCNFVTSWKNY